MVTSDDRPSSFGQALESSGFDASGSTSDAPESTAAPTESTADASSASTVADPSSDAATAAASPTETPQQPEPPPGPLPYERHKAILDKAYAERDGLKAQMESLAWAQQLPAGIGPEFVAMAQRAKGDPVAFLMEFAAQVQNDPRHAAALKSHAARMLGTRSAAPSQVEMPEAARSGVPELDAVLDARDRAMAERLASQLGLVVDERVAPLTDLAQHVAKARAHQAANEWADAEIAKVSKFAGFEDNRAEISAVFDAEIAKFPREQWDQMAPIVLRDAYAAVVPQKLSTSSGQQLLKTLTAKASASSLGTSPTVAATATRPRSWGDAFKQAGLS